MKKIYSIISLLTGLLCGFYFAVQADLIKLKMFIEDYKYNESFDNIFQIYSYVLIVLCIIIIVLSIMGIRKKWQNWPILGLATAFICILSLVLMGGIPIFFLAFIVIGLMGLVMKHQ